MFFSVSGLCSDKHFMREYLKKVFFDKFPRCWLLADSCWLLVVGCWWLVVGVMNCRHLPTRSPSPFPNFSIFLSGSNVNCFAIMLPQVGTQIQCMQVCVCISMCVIVVTCSFIDINMNKCDRSTSAD